MPKVEQHQPEISVGLKGTGADVQPEWIERKGEKEKVSDVLASWAEGGQGPGQRGWPSRLNRTFFRVRTARGAIYEIAHVLPEGRKSAARWVLVRQLQDEAASNLTRSPAEALAETPERPPKAAPGGAAGSKAPKEKSVKRKSATSATPKTRVGG